MRRFQFAPLAAACCALSMLSNPAEAQQVMAHISALPPAAGLNPQGFGTIVADPLNRDLFVVSNRGLSVADQAAATFVNFELGPDGSAFANGIAFDPAHRRLLVTDGGSSTLIVLDGLTRTVLARLALPFVGGRIVADSAAKRAYILSATSNEIAAVALPSLAITAAVPLPDVPSRIAVNRSTGRVYVTSSAAASTWVMNPDLSLKTTLATGATSSEIAINPVSARAYVVRTDGNVAILDVAGDTIIKTVAALSARLVVVHEGTGFAYVSSATAGNPPLSFPESQIIAINASDNVLAPVRLGGTPAGNAVADLAIDPVGNRLFASEFVKLSAGRVTTFSVSGALTRTGAGFTNQASAAPIVWSPANSRLYVANGTSVLTEMNPAAALAATQIVMGASLTGGALNEVGGKSFNLDAAADRVLMVDTTAPALPPVSTLTGAIPTLAQILPARNEVFVLNQISRSISVLDATTGVKLRDKTGVGADVTFGFALDRAATPGATGLLVGLSSSFFPANPAWVQTYEPTLGDTLTPISGDCFTSACVVGAATDSNETAHRFYVNAVYNLGAAASLAVYDAAATPKWKSIAIPGAQQLPGFLLRYDAPTNQVFLDADSTTQARLVAVTDVATPVVSPIVLGGSATALELANGNLYVAEAGAGQIEIFDATTHNLINPVATGGAPVDLRVVASVPYLWVQNDGLASPGVQVYDTSGQRAMLSDIGYFGAGRSILAPASGNLTVIDNQHGSIAMIDPMLPPSDMQIDRLSLPDGNTSRNYTSTVLGQTSGTAPFVWSVVSGQLPPGLALDPSTGEIAGLPTQEGIYSFMVKLTDSRTPPAVDVEDFQIQILNLRLVTVELPKGQCGAYSVNLLAAGGTPPYSWSSTTLPAGLTLDGATGIISGTPTANASCPPLVDITVVDADLTSVTTPLCLEVSVSGSLPLVANQMLALKTLTNVELAFPALAPPVAGYNVYRSNPPAPVTWARLGGNPSTTTATYVDSGAVPASPTLMFYAARTADACGNESTEPLF